MNDALVPVSKVSPGMASIATQKPDVIFNCARACSLPLVVIGAWAFSGSAQAQSAAVTSADEGATLEEVVVTAEKRGESIQNVPISMTALTGDSLRDAGVTNATELADQVPSLAIGNNGDSIEIFVRGIGSTNDTEVGDPAVAFNVDGVYIGRPSGAGGTFFDMNRIEVLRGPQGTLYGRNATAGAVNVITNDPTQGFEASGEMTFGNYDTIDTGGVVNVPLSDNLAVRGAFHTESHDGYLNNRNVTQGVTSNADDAQNAAGRFKALYTPTEELSVLLSADYFHAGGVGPSQVPFSIIHSGGSAGRTNPLDTQGSLDDTFAGGSADINYKWGPVKLTSLTAYRINNRNGVDDLDQTATYAPAQIGTFRILFHQLSEEFRAASDSPSPLQWVTGVYYYDEHNNVYFDIQRAISPTLGLRFVQPTVRESSKAAFGQLDFNFTDALRLSAGVRGTRDDKSRYGQTDLVDDGATETVIADILPNSASISSSKVNWKATLDWHWRANNSVYVSAGTGYKAGGYDDGSANNTYKPENLTAYEIGSKNDFFGNRARVNLSAYYYDYRNFQISEVTQLPDEPQGAQGTVTYNAQKATAYGLEWENLFKITAADQVDLAATYEHTVFNEFTLPGATVTPACPDGFVQPNANDLCVLTGNRLQHAPSFTVSAGYQHTWQLDNGAGLRAAARTYYSTSYYLFPSNSPLMEQGAYTSTGLTFGYHASKDRFYVELFGRNLEDHNVAIQGSLVNGETFASLAPPRTYGISFGARLGE